jgi:hypothetical protein
MSSFFSSSVSLSNIKRIDCSVIFLRENASLIDAGTFNPGDFSDYEYQSSVCGFRNVMQAAGLTGRLFND